MTGEGPVPTLDNQPEPWEDLPGTPCIVCGERCLYGDRHTRCAPGYVAPSTPPADDPSTEEQVLRTLLATAERERDALQRIIDGYDRTPAETRAHKAEQDRDEAVTARNSAMRQRNEEREAKEGNWRALHEEAEKRAAAEAERDALQRQVDAARALADSDLRALQAVRSVCMDTDGDYLDGDAEIPVGEVLRMLAESVGLDTLEQAALDAAARADRAGGAS